VISRLRPLASGANPYLLAAITSALIVLLGGAVLGARNTARDPSRAAYERRGGPDRSLAGAPEAVDPLTGEVAPDANGAASAPTATSGPGGGRSGTGPAGSVPAQSQPGATREGIFSDHIRVGVHAPITFDGQPLNLADDPITGFKGYVTHLNRSGGVHGRKIRVFLEDDRYTTGGGRQVADKLVKEIKPFIISGTLGVDQIYLVAKSAGDAGIPYMAVGGPEPEWRTMGMFQLGSSYDQYVGKLADWICKNGKAYVGENEVRIGTTTLDSPYILPVRDRFLDRLAKGGCVVTPIDPNANDKIIKPTEQNTYQGQLLKLRNSYGGKGANLVVPLQDPISTARQVAELKPYKGQGYSPKWTFSNFAHDSDTALALMAGEWTGVRGLSGGCYYHPNGNPNAYNPAQCARIDIAHDQWVNLGQVTFDENAGGCGGGRCNYNYNESTWTEDGSGGAAGYQLLYFWHGALNAMGPDPTREKFVAALRAYDNYSNLVTGPITFKGSGNVMRGADKVALLEGQSNLKFKQITPGLVDQF